MTMNKCRLCLGCFLLLFPILMGKKGKVAPVHSYHAISVWRNGVVAAPFLNLPLDGGEWSACRSCLHIPGNIVLGTQKALWDPEPIWTR